MRFMAKEIRVGDTTIDKETLRAVDRNFCLLGIFFYI
jgi:hypothetical protein